AAARAPARARPHRARPRRGELRPGAERAADRVDLPPDRAAARADPDPLRAPPPAARRGAVLARPPDPAPERPLRAACLLPRRAGRPALRRRRRRRPPRRGLDLRARVGLALRGPTLARAEPRDHRAAAPPAPAQPPDADAPLPARAPERLAAARGGVGRPQPRREGRLAPPLRASRRGPRPPLAADRVVHGALRRRGDRDRPRRRLAVPDPPAARDRPQLGAAGDRVGGGQDR